MVDCGANEREPTANALPRRRGLHGIAASLLGGLGFTAAASGATAQQNGQGGVEGIIESAMEKVARLRGEAERAAGWDERPQRNNERDADDGDRGGRNGRAAERDGDNDEPRRRSSEQEANDNSDDAPRRRDARQETDPDSDTDATTDAGSDTGGGGGGGGANNAGDADADADGDSIEMGDINVDDDFDVQQVISNLNLSEFGADDGDGDVIATTGPDGAVAISGDSIARSGPGGSFAQSGDSIASSGPDGATAISGGGGDADGDGGDDNDFAS